VYGRLAQELADHTPKHCCIKRHTTLPIMNSFFDKILDNQILIVGDVMIDGYISGKVNRISPEAPVPVVEYQSRIHRLGGAANVALNIKALGAKPILLSIIGDDENKAIFEGLLNIENIDSQYIVRSIHRQTTIKTRVMAGTQQLLRIDREDTHELNQEEEEAVLDAFQAVVQAHDIKCIVFQDYNKGLLNPKIIKKIIHYANENDIPTAVDPKKKNFFAYQNVTLFKPNLKEISDALQEKIKVELSSLEQVTASLRAAMPHRNTMITLSEKGIYTFDGVKSSLQDTIPRNIADVCGAGDTVIAVAALGLAAALPIANIAALANIAGGQVCEEVGVVPIQLKRFRAEIDKLG
jgi:D-glycero-beta-D-manno-heptose-7-phosphate kinase